MKIKCPFWNECFFESEAAELFTHLKTQHNSGEITHAYWELIVKIHDSIKDEDKTTVISRMYSIPILKSLLENEK